MQQSKFLARHAVLVRYYGQAEVIISGIYNATKLNIPLQNIHILKSISRRAPQLLFKY